MVPVGEGHGRSCPATPTRRIITARQLFTFPSPWDAAPLPPRPRPSHERPWQAPSGQDTPRPSGDQHPRPRHSSCTHVGEGWRQQPRWGSKIWGAVTIPSGPPRVDRDPPWAGPAKVRGSGGREVAVARAGTVARVTHSSAKCSLGQAGAPRGWHVAGTSHCIPLGTSQREWGAGTWPMHHGAPWAQCHGDPFGAHSAIKPSHKE